MVKKALSKSSSSQTKLGGTMTTRLPISQKLLKAYAFGVLCFCPLVFASDPVLVRTRLLSELAIYPESSAPALVVALNDTPIAAQIDAIAEQVLVKVGDSVKAGTILVKLVCGDFELERSRLQAEQRTIQARLDLTHWQLKQADTLASQQVLPEEQLQEKRAQLAVLQGELAAQAARLNLTERQISQCLVKAPFSGVVTARLIADGQLITRGTIMLQLLDANLTELSAQVPSQDIDALKQASALRFESGEQRYPVTLRSVLPAVQTATATRELRLDFKAARADSGSSGRLVWRSALRHVPAEYLLQRDGRIGVFIADHGQARFRPLPDAQVGQPAALGDLPDTAAIVTSGQFQLTDGALINSAP